MTEHDPSPALRIDAVTKRFGALTANDAISFDLRRGEVLALLGENGAGKTTLMNIVFGHYVADEGNVAVFGARLKPGDPRAALGAGVGMVHQHFALADNMTVLDNVVLGTEPLWQPWSRRGAARARLRTLSEETGLAVDPDIAVGRLSVGERQRVEILKALYRHARILILDEPTAVLTPQEAEGLFATLRRLVARGFSIIFISHKLGEVLSLADRVVVLRQGKVVLTRPTAGASRDELAEAMVGRALPPPALRTGTAGAVALRLQGIAAHSADRRLALKGIDLELRHGEVFGIAGVSGNGQTLLADLVSGTVRPHSGSIEIAGTSVGRLTPQAAIAAGFGRIPEDRHSSGVVAAMSVADNAVLERFKEGRFARWNFRRRRSTRAHATMLMATYDVRGGDLDSPVRRLSGGNIQKLILGRALIEEPSVVIANQPTRGLDVGAVAFVQEQLSAARSRGAAVLLISEDLDELLALSDRIAVMYRGRLSAARRRGELDVTALGLMMAGDGFEGADHAA
ncbi:MAG: ABC transporter ATP-binding protein [Alphaproteobacteria bacterium]|nr:ABC transporter ATP-binding protein [Alphaproteobacteria bacterium]